MGQTTKPPPDTYAQGKLPKYPTHHYPGSLAKLDVMAERLAHGEMLFHPDDARPRGDEATVPTKMHRLVYSGSQRISQVKEKVVGRTQDWPSGGRRMTAYILSEQQWRRVSKLIPLRHGLDRQKKAVQLNQHRNAINGILFVLYRGIKWDDLPKRYCYFGAGRSGRGHGVNRMYNHWRPRGLWTAFMRAAKAMDKDNRILWHKLQMTTVQGE